MAKRWTQSLGLKLFVAFALVATLGVGTVALASRQAVARQFTIYVSQGRQQRAAQWAEILSSKLQDMSTDERAAAWSEIEELVQSLFDSTGTGRGDGQGRGQGRGRQLNPDDRILILDPDRRVLYDGKEQLVGQTTGDLLQLPLREFRWIAVHASLRASEGQAHHPALPGHPHGQRAHLSQLDRREVP